MAEDRIQRKLAALFAADVAGYSRLMALDEEFTSRKMTEYRELMDDMIDRFGGRIANTAGDSVLAEFSSSVEAVRCATEIQEVLRTRNSDLPKDRRIDFRIGISVGDVIQKDGDLFGDGVNVAARLESIAYPGGICVSGEVRDQIEGKIALDCVSLGNAKLKNLGRPVRAYALGHFDGGSTTFRKLSLFLNAHWSKQTMAATFVLAVLAIGYFVTVGSTLFRPLTSVDIAKESARLD